MYKCNHDAHFCVVRKSEHTRNILNMSQPKVHNSSRNYMVSRKKTEMLHTAVVIVKKAAV